MPPLNIEEMKRRRLKRDKQQNVVRKEEEEEVAAQVEAAKEEARKVARDERAFRKKMIADTGVKSHNWRLNTPNNPSHEEDLLGHPASSVGDHDEARPRVDLPKPPNPALAVADHSSQCKQLAQEAQNAEDSVGIAQVLVQTGSAEEQTVLRLSASGGNLDSIMELEGELSGTVRELQDWKQAADGALLKDANRGHDLRKLLQEAPPHLKEETEALASELEDLTRAELGLLIQAEEALKCKAELIEGDANSIHSVGGRHMATAAVEEFEAAERQRKFDEAERERIRRCELRAEWMSKGVVDDARMQARWKAQEEARETRRQVVKAMAKRRAILRMCWMRFSRQHVGRCEKATALRADAVGCVMGLVMEGLNVHIEESVRKRKEADREARNLLRTQLQLRDVSYQQRSKAAAATRLARAYKCHRARTRVSKLRGHKLLMAGDGS